MNSAASIALSYVPLAILGLFFAAWFYALALIARDIYSAARNPETPARIKAHLRNCCALLWDLLRWAAIAVFVTALAASAVAIALLAYFAFAARMNALSPVQQTIVGSALFICLFISWIRDLENMQWRDRQ